MKQRRLGARLIHSRRVSTMPANVTRYIVQSLLSGTLSAAVRTQIGIKSRIVLTVAVAMTERIPTRSPVNLMSCHMYYLCCRFRRTSTCEHINIARCDFPDNALDRSNVQSHMVSIIDA